MPSPAKLLASASGASVDPNFRNVTLLLHGDGSNGAQNNTFIDGSTNNFTITRNGNTTQGSFTPYGSLWSNYFDGNNDSLTYTGGSSLAFGTGDFTIELWAYLTNTGTFSAFLRADDTGNFPDFGYDFSAGQLKFDARGTAIVSVTTSMPTSQWAHIAVCRSGTNLRLFINGSQVGTTTTNSTNFGTTTGTIRIGGSSFSTSHTVSGYLSNFRVLNGTALYTANFTPPITPLTAITNTSLLTCQSNRFRDASTNNFAITRNGDVTVTPFSPFAPSSPYSATANGGSMYFDGSGDFLQPPNNSAFSFGSGNFTAEAWFYAPSTVSSTQHIVGSWDTAGTLSWSMFLTATNKVGFSFTTTGTYSPALDINSTISLSTGAWNHLAFVRNGSAFDLYLNGTSVASVTNSSAMYDYPQATKIGSNANGQSFAGYLSNLRIVKGTAVYTAAFTPPTAPVTAITNTSLLLNGTNAAIFDSTSDNNLETVGNAQISTSVKKFGTGSMYFDGTGDWLTTLGGNQFAFGTGDFTIECWINKPSAGNGPIIDARGSSVAAPYALYVDGSNYPYFYDGTSYTSSVAITNNQWNHVAVTRSSGTLRIFVNGTQGYSGTVTTNMTAGSTIYIGGQDFSSPATMTGYIDDLRITKGVARYTANFTPPTAAFPDQ